MGLPFVFDEHILEPNDERIARRRKIREVLPGLAGRIYDWLFLVGLETRQNMNQHHYCLCRDAFQEIAEGGMADVEYIFREDLNSHTARISGSGFEKFKLRNEPEYFISADKKAKQTNFPVMFGSQEGTIIIYDYPERSSGLGAFSTIHLEYTFSTEIDLGSDFMPEKKKFTNRIGRISQCSPSGRILYFKGVPGKVIFRAGDAVFNELGRAVFGSWIYPAIPRDKLRMQGTVTASDMNEVVYIGNMETIGSFPFFLERDNSDREGGRAPVSSPVAVSR